jgi:hypothetical protein
VSSGVACWAADKAANSVAEGAADGVADDVARVTADGQLMGYTWSLGS